MNANEEPGDDPLSLRHGGRVAGHVRPPPGRSWQRRRLRTRRSVPAAAYPGIYSEAGLRRARRPRRVRARPVIGHAGEGLAIGLRKNWGRSWASGRSACDPVDAFHVLYIFKDHSPYNRRVLQRRAMKRRLPRTCAAGSTRHTATPAATSWRSCPRMPLRRSARLSLDPIGFWRAARGR